MTGVVEYQYVRRHHRVIPDAHAFSHADGGLIIDADTVADDELSVARHLEPDDPRIAGPDKDVVADLDRSISHDLRHGAFELEAGTDAPAAVAEHRLPIDDLQE